MANKRTKEDLQDTYEAVKHPEIKANHAIRSTFGANEKHPHEATPDPPHDFEQMDTTDTAEKPGSDRDISKPGRQMWKTGQTSVESVEAHTTDSQSDGTESMETSGEQSGSEKNKFEPGQERRGHPPESVRSVKAEISECKAEPKTKSQDIRPSKTTVGKTTSSSQDYVQNDKPGSVSAERPLTAMKMLQRSMDEEFERRELDSLRFPTKLARSKIPSPSHEHKSFKTVESIVKAQLFMVENQTVACPPEVLAEVTEDLRIRSIKWAAVRTDNKIYDMLQTDYYISKLYEILVKGSIDHHFPQRFDVSQESMKEAFTKLLAGAHATDKLDERFKANRDTNVAKPDTRCGDSVEDGVEKIRLACNNQKINECLDKDLKTIEGENIR